MLSVGVGATLSVFEIVLASSMAGDTTLLDRFRTKTITIAIAAVSSKSPTATPTITSINKLLEFELLESPVIPAGKLLAVAVVATGEYVVIVPVEEASEDITCF
jgi:hypothetical protein